MTLKRTPLHDVHVALGAKMVPYAGFEMPVNYPSGISSEHRAVR
ncbi:MAG TPA: glycine cleavage system aminomethyltransferase GcvT, partial [Gemmatimonadales bacterium]|nr:glycine cleavage system aminomethyltransferase GcvT [Gemmatimonadales bacterium]